MPRILKYLLAALLLWMLTGIYIVGGNERAAVRRFGRAVTNSEGVILLKRNGLHFDWPWPFSRVDRMHFNEIRTLNVPVRTPAPAADAPLLAENLPAEPAFITGDKNLLNIYLAVQYRVDESQVGEFLYGSNSLENRLTCLVESAAASLLARSGVDYVQVSGLAEWRRTLTRELQHQADRQQLGVIIEEISLEEISPPLEVKADFLDVANARADREQFIQAALSAADQKKQSAQAEAREIRDAAEAEARQMLQAAEGSAARFLQIIGPFRSDPHSPNSTNHTLARRLAMERYYFQALAEILERVKGQVFLDTGQPVDLTIFGSSKPKPPAPSSATDAQPPE